MDAGARMGSRVPRRARYGRFRAPRVSGVRVVGRGLIETELPDRLGRIEVEDRGLIEFVGFRRRQARVTREAPR